MMVVGDTFNEVYQAAASQVHGGQVTAPRGLSTREVVGAHLVLRDPTQNVLTVRQMNFRFMIAEWLWMLTGQTRVDILTQYNGEMARFSDDGQHLAGSYGPPLADQLPWVIRKLEEDEPSRQALASIWRERPGSSKDVPCTVMMQFLVRDGRLSLITYMRSNDIWLGLPYDLFNFTMIQRYVAEALSLDLGPYHHMVGSLHVYEEHLIALQLTAGHAEITMDSGDLIPAYPWPHEALSALLEARDYQHGIGHDRLPGGWASIIDLMVGRTPSRWTEVVAQLGLEPKGWWS